MSVFRVIAIISLLVLGLGCYGLLRRSRFPRLPALLNAWMLMLATISFATQLLFHLELSRYHWLLDILYVTIGLTGIQTAVRDLREISWQECNYLTLKRYRFVWLFIPGILYLNLQALLVTPTNYDSMVYNLSRVFIFINEGTLHTENYSSHRQVMMPLGWDIIYFHILRLQTDVTTGLLNFSAYGILCLAAFRFVKARYETLTTLFISFLVASLLGVVLQSTSTKNDLPLTALALICVGNLLEYNHKKNITYIAINILLVIFAVQIKSYFIALLLPLFLAHAWLFLKDPISVQSIKKLIFWQQLWPLVWGIPGLLVYLIFLKNNSITFGSIGGEIEFVERHRNQQGLLGMLANLMRFTIQAYLPDTRLGGQWLADLIYSGVPAWLQEPGSMGSKLLHLSQNPASPFPMEDASWYGPLASLFGLPALIFALFRKDAIEKFLAFGTLLALALLCYLLAWNLAIGRFMAFVFVSGFLCVAPFVKLILARRWLFRLAIFCVAVSFWFGILFNQDRPFLNQYELTYSVLKKYNKLKPGSFKLKSAGKDYPGPMFFSWIHSVADRSSYARLHYMDSTVLDFFKEEDKLTPGSRLLIVASGNDWVYPFLILRPDIIKSVMMPNRAQDCLQNKSSSCELIDNILIIGKVSHAHLNSLQSTTNLINSNIDSDVPLSLMQIHTEYKAQVR